MQICTVPTVLTARRHLAAARYDEVAQWLSATNTVETPMRVNTAEVALVNVRAQPQRCPHSYGEPVRARTGDLLIKSQLLYQLSYRPTRRFTRKSWR